MWGMIAGSAISMLGSVMDSKNRNAAIAAQEEARRKQRIQMVRQANLADAALRLKDRSNFEAARLELENQTLSHVKARASVTTAIGESNLEGRSMDRIKRDVENVHLRTKGMINENYKRDYQNILAQRESTRDNLIEQLKNDGGAYRKVNPLGEILNVGIAGAQGAKMGVGFMNFLNDF